MQIIIVQAEIEAAIRNYINSQLNVKDGHRIDIELSATRGADGFKATIDIVAANAPSLPKADPEAGPAPAPTPSPAKAEAAVVRSVTSSPAPAPKEEAPAKEALQESGASIAGAAADSAGTAPTAGEAGNASPASASGAAATDATPAAAAAEGEPKPARSLFAGLKKPVNA